MLTVDQFESRYGFRPNVKGTVCRGGGCDPTWVPLFEPLEGPVLLPGPGTTTRITMTPYPMVEFVQPIQGAYQTTINVVYARM